MEQLQVRLDRVAAETGSSGVVRHADPSGEPDRADGAGGPVLEGAVGP